MKDKPRHPGQKRHQSRRHHHPRSIPGENIPPVPEERTTLKSVIDELLLPFVETAKDNLAAMRMDGRLDGWAQGKALWNKIHDETLGRHRDEPAAAMNELTDWHMADRIVQRLFALMPKAFLNYN